MRSGLWILSACVVGWLAAQPGAAEPASAGSELLGKPAPAWQLTRWINSPALTQHQLRGKVVLLRWWTEDCPFCSATAPALSELDARYRGRGLQVIGVYHHKTSDPFTPDDVARYAKLLHFGFPIAIDPHWKTLKSWWLTGPERDFTSVSFVIDKHGIIRHVHPGGKYVKGDPDYAALESVIERLLREPG